MPNEKNIQTVQNLKEKVAKAKSITFAEYHGLSSNDINELRSKIKENDAEMIIAKNTLLKIALNDENVDTSNLEEDLKGPTTAIFSYTDPIAPIKTLFEFAKNLELPAVKSALIEGVYNTAQQVEILSNLPSREELLAQVLHGFNAPLSGFANTIGGVQRKFVYALSALADKNKES